MSGLANSAAKPAIRWLVAAARRPFARWHLVRATKRETHLKMNVGGGNRPLAGWINTDIGWRASNYLDLLQSWPMRGKGVSFVYADNVIEHFSLSEARVVLKHAFDALEPGGAMRLVTPDVERIARAYVDDPDLTRRRLERHKRHGYDVTHPVDLLRVLFAESGHHLGYCFDYASLSSELLLAGFTEIERAESGQSKIPEFVGLESRTDPTDTPTTLIIECRRSHESRPSSSES